MTASTSLPPAARAGIRRAILAWYDAAGRTLAFRGTTDPYEILVSETMSQQTRVGRVGPAWRAFVDRFPTVAALAAAPTADVVRQWAGLGYNRRAILLQRAARAIVGDHGGAVPGTVAELERLPGVGPYTARAVAAIAFGLPVGAVDTNVRRVLGRAIAGDARGPAAADIQAIADALVPPDRPADWTHAVMDVGAMYCRPRRPACGDCPVAGSCRYASSGGATEAPRPAAAGAAAMRSRPAFPSTSRWLRGRIVDRLRDGTPGEWQRLEPPIGEHVAAAVERALAAIERDGVAERHPNDPLLARLPAG